MDPVFYLMEIMKHPYNKEGVCRGLAMMAQSACQVGEYDEKYVRRIKLLTKLEREGADIHSLIAKAQSRYKSEKPLLPDDILLTLSVERPSFKR